MQQSVGLSDLDTSRVKSRSVAVCCELIRISGEGNRDRRFGAICFSLGDMTGLLEPGSTQR
jgi:hypothetical protein